jgi:hypothetical protein
MKLFKITTDRKNSMTIPAKSEFHARKLFLAKYAKSFGKPAKILDITPRGKKPVVKITASGRELS